jgi:hypothetical protein
MAHTHGTSAGRRARLAGLGALVMLLGTMATARAAGQAPASPADNHILYMALVHVPAPPPTPQPPIANASFEDDFWVDWPSDWPRCRHDDPDGSKTDANGNQHPSGWTFYSPAEGVVMPFPTRRQNGGSVPAISNGPGEYVHRCAVDGPPDEMVGQPRAILTHGDISFKAFHPFIRHALQLSQEVTAPPGTHVRVKGHILAEIHAQCNAPLEDDHYIASVQLGNATDTRWYSDMKDRRDVSGNERAWNEFSVDDIVPGNGKLLLKVIVQSNAHWEVQGSCGADFFLDNFRFEQLSAAGMGAADVAPEAEGNEAP